MRPEAADIDDIYRPVAVEVGQAGRRLREAGAAGVAASDGAPLGEQYAQIERVNATVGYAAWAGESAPA